MKLGKLAAWVLFYAFDARNGAAFAQRVERWGYDAIWIPEAHGRDPLIGASWILANTTMLKVATGVANIYARDSLATVNAQYALAEQSADRFLLGVGVSHIPLVEGLRGHKYEKPIAAMTAYLESMKNATYGGPAPAETPKTVIAALGPRMLEVAAKHADGAHPYNVTSEHTAEARRILGPISCYARSAGGRVGVQGRCLGSTPTCATSGSNLTLGTRSGGRLGV